jgi:hypothetical protein
MRKPKIISGLSVDTVEPQEEEGFSEPWGGRRIIAWDGEGMNLRGPGKPQNYVLFGCSANVSGPLIGKNLMTGDLLNYMCDIAADNPRAVHVAYSFKYDVNMIIKDFTWMQKAEFNEKGSVTVDKGWMMCPKSWGFRYYISYIPGKIFKVTRLDLSTKERVTIRIDDVFSFFARKFLTAVESILGKTLSDEDRQVIAKGKEDRGSNMWPDLPEVRHYWEAEIVLMERMMVEFRNVMYRAGFKLQQWYGPGAIASYLMQTRKLYQHIQNTPEIPEVHNASKHAYTGGRFELFQMGRVQGPVFGYDINSAYPYALSNSPSLGVDHGQWTHRTNPDRIDEFACYRISFQYGRENPLATYAAMPLFHRDRNGSMSYPPVTEGWYWSPEAAIAKAWGTKFGGVTIHEAWVWEHDDTRPFKFLEEMYNTRQVLGKKNVISMPYKLGPNSMYGKFAQRVGAKNGPPKTHCLPLAGWITSNCRASLFRLMIQIPQSQLIAVETDGIYTTVPPESIRATFGDALGQWGVDRYDEMLYLQNGIYHRRKGDEWQEPKSRGLDIASVPFNVVKEFLQNAGPGQFPEMSVKMKPRFVALRAAMVGDPTGVSDRHCVWKEGTRDISPGSKGKRVHSLNCPQCKAGRSAWDAPHPLAVFSRSGIDSPVMSQPHRLPWETSETYADVERGHARNLIEEDLLL